MVTGVPAGLLTGHFDKMACVVVAASRGRGSVPTGVEGDQDALTGVFFSGVSLSAGIAGLTGCCFVAGLAGANSGLSLMGCLLISGTG
jgi:hypothetical protein